MRDAVPQSVPDVRPPRASKNRIAGATVLWLLCINGAHAQSISPGADPSAVGNVRVHVEYANAHAAGPRLRVRLMSGAGSTTIAESFTNNEGGTEFTSVPIGEYHIVVSGEGIQDADSGMFEVDRRKVSQSVFIVVRPSESPGNGGTIQGINPVSKTELAIPPRALKESDRATKAIANKEWNTALKHLNRAIEIYPDYALVYNNLGVVYGQLNQIIAEREALQRAISIDNQFAPPYVNLAKLCLRERDALQAESLLEAANRAESNNAETMTLLAQAQLLNERYDDAIRTAHDVHAIPHANFAVVHYVAARAMERQGHPQGAVAELQIFLTEEPNGARADHVRQEISHLQQNQK